MNWIKSYRKKFLIFLLVCFLVMSLSYLQTFLAIPGEITLLEGQESIYHFKSPFSVSIKAQGDGIIHLNNSDIKVNGNVLSLSKPLTFQPQKNGRVNLSMKLFGLIPFRNIVVDIMPNKKVVACGNTIGVKLKMSGILVIGVSDVLVGANKKVTPAKDSGIRTGDILLEVNQTKLKDIDDLIHNIENSKGSRIQIKYRRGASVFTAYAAPVRASDDKKLHLGMWVRDNTAGIGTMTFYDPNSKYFGALGHGITDIDTGMLIPVQSGELLESTILAVKRGQQGVPGELKGLFVEDRNKLGSIKTNSMSGIYGILTDECISGLPQKQYSIALRSQVKEGRASILANVDGRKIEEFEVEILKVSRQSTNGSKGMIIKVTDKRLLETTGGIVQGMSGSPILQNDKIIGAVTHVLVNDPARGYGTFIESMLKNLIGLDVNNKIGA